MFYVALRPSRLTTRVTREIFSDEIDIYSDIVSGSSDIISSLKPDGFSIDSAERLTRVLRQEGRNEARDTSFKWGHLLCVYDDAVGDGQKGHVVDRCHVH